MAESKDNIIEVHHLSKLYGPNREAAVRMMKQGSDKDEVFKKTGATVALWDVNLKIKRGGIFVVIGLSGSGKSTVVRCLNRLNRPSSGSVLFLAAAGRMRPCRACLPVMVIICMSGPPPKKYRTVCKKASPAGKAVSGAD